MLPSSLYVAKNITEQKRVEAQLRNSLNEKQVLLKEIHHRVKNNLQIISSLISLQSRRAREPEAENIFHDSENRIRSMALIHEQLYRSEELNELVSNAIEHAFPSASGGEGRIGFKANEEQ